MTWKIALFRSARGESPVEEFIKQQDKATYARILLYIKLLRDNGPFLKPPYIKKLQSKLYELRISGKIQIRIFYTLHNNEYYLLHVFKKKSQKTPLKDLKVALDRLKGIT
jgi:phage-related protein